MYIHQHVLAFHADVRLEMIQHYYGGETDEDRVSGVRGTQNWGVGWGRRTESAAAAQGGAAHIRSLIRKKEWGFNRVLKLKRNKQNDDDACVRRGRYFAYFAKPFSSGRSESVIGNVEHKKKHPI